VKRRDLVVELITTLVEAPVAASGHLLRHGKRQLPRARRLDEAGGELEHVECTARIPIGCLRQQFERCGLRVELLPAETAFGIAERGAQERQQLLDRQRAQHVHARAR
jgi:hypothetical protein